MALSSIGKVAVDEGAQKYVLVKAKQTEAENVFLVRGNKHAPYHKDVARPLVNFLTDEGIVHTVMGGGMLELDSTAQSVSIYGASYGYPWAGKPMHNIAKKLLQEHLGDSFTIHAEGEDEA